MNAVNLIPSDQRRAKASGNARNSSYFVLGLLGVLLVMAVAYVLTANGVNDKTTKAAEAQQEADALEAQVAQLGSYTNFSSIKDQRLAAVTAAAQTRFDWERLMREVSRVMPEGSWLQSTDASVYGVGNTEAATQNDSGAAVVAADPSANFIGCTPKQSEVAKILVRLRAMHRVTDVKLNESIVEQGATDVTVDSCGKLYKFDVTVSFAPAVATEAPRGSESVPASLGGGS
jgi:Tfp pilus assembly protein PilN